MTWDILQSAATGEFMLVPTGEPHPDGWVFQAVTANPDYLKNEGLPHDPAAE